jgi:hypothetical protein
MANPVTSKTGGKTAKSCKTLQNVHIQPCVKDIHGYSTLQKNRQITDSIQADSY